MVLGNDLVPRLVHVQLLVFGVYYNVYYCLQAVISLSALSEAVTKTPSAALWQAKGNNSIYSSVYNSTAINTVKWKLQTKGRYEANDFVPCRVVVPI